MLREIYYYLKYKKIHKYGSKDMEKYQISEIKKLLDYAYKNFECYRRLYDEHDINPSDFKKLSDIRKFPIIRKENLKKEIEKISKNKNNYLWLRSSGSTGKPFKIPINKSALSKRRATILLSYKDLGLSILSKKGIFWRDVREGSIKKIIKEKLIRRYWFPIYDTKIKNNYVDEKKFEKFYYIIQKYKIKIIDGYPSAIYEFCKFLNKKNIKIRMNLITTGGEKLSDNTRKYIEKTLRGKIYDRYGGTELSLMAHQLPNTRGKYQLYNFRLYCWSDEKNNLILTDFTNRAIPLINYEVGDQASVSGDNKYISNIYGRIIENFNVGDKILNGHFFQKIFREYTEIENYQVVQVKNKIFDVNLISSKKIPGIKNRLESQFKDLIFKINYVSKFKNKNKHLHLIKIN